DPSATFGNAEKAAGGEMNKIFVHFTACCGSGGGYFARYILRSGASSTQVVFMPSRRWQMLLGTRLTVCSSKPLTGLHVTVAVLDSTMNNSSASTSLIVPALISHRPNSAPKISPSDSAAVVGSPASDCSAGTGSWASSTDSASTLRVFAPI